MRKEASLPVELYRNRRLVFSLAKNDFKTKYAGSYFGTVWAFIQPIVTICVYWFVFGLALRNGADRGVPFVLWLVAGLVPWFFIQEGLTGGTASLLEYNYLVKKVVFNIRILPVVKVFSAVFVHCFFIVIILVIYTCMGYPPDLYALQLIYYSFCTFMLILGITYLTSSVVVFLPGSHADDQYRPAGGGMGDSYYVEFQRSGTDRHTDDDPEAESCFLYCAGLPGFPHR